jgi:FAD/FMN-containing dehydrogenase
MHRGPDRPGLIAPAGVSPEVRAALAASFRGPLLSAADSGYDEQRRVWNAMIDRRPALIARCTGTADVVAAVNLAREQGLLVSVRGGGHNIAGLAVCEGGLMIDLSLMRGVWVDPGAATVVAQGGCTLGDVDRETQLHGQAAVLGFVSATGIAGLTTGGGFGYLTRKYGWTCDNVASMDVVTAAGTVVRASATENQELFWCLRGGGGNFGIVTSFNNRTYPVGPTILGGMTVWKAEDAPRVLRAWAEIAESAPRELTMVALMRNAPPAPWLPKEIHGQPIVGVLACHLGRPEDGEKLLAPLHALPGPVASTLVPRPYAQLQGLLDATQPRGRRYYWKSEYLPGLDPAMLEVFRARAAANASPHSAVILFQVGGALNELPAGHSPVGNRDARYVLNVAGSWDAAADDEANVAWVRESWQALQPFSTGGVYLNFLTEDEGAERTTAAYGPETLARLAALKSKYDPQNLFRHTRRFA